MAAETAKEKKMAKRRSFEGMMVLVLAFGLVLGACGKSVNGLLDDYEKVVDEMVAYAQAAAESASDAGDTASALAKVATMQKKLEGYQKKLEKTVERLGAAEDRMTEEQTARFYQISFKMIGLME
jgi:hypothetical protein